MLNSVLFISIGASLGATIRWLLGVSLNSLFPTIPPGTLVANLLGGFLIGAAITFLADQPNLAPEWRLLVVTGFLGALTTFSTFSAEVTSLIQEGRLLWAGAAMAVHLFGSLAMTMLGIATVYFIKSI